MRITFLTTAAGPDFNVSPGQTIDLPEDQAQSFVDGGYAAWVDRPAEPAEPAEPETDDEADEPPPTINRRKRANHA